jgi:hypothetical protein
MPGWQKQLSGAYKKAYALLVNGSTIEEAQQAMKGQQHQHQQRPQAKRR